jgi:RNA polymerase sigma-70 factor (ECF subfamily)
MPPRDPENARWFAEEVQPHEPALRAWLRSRFPTLKDADDLVQESYTRLLRARETGSIACAKAFLFITARNLALNQLRHLRHERPEGITELDASGVLDSGVAIPESVARAEDLQLLIHAIQSLPDRCRQIMTLRKIYGLSQKEVAARLGISEHTVEAQGAIGLRKCIEYFRRHGYGHPSAGRAFTP